MEKAPDAFSVSAAVPSPTWLTLSQISSGRESPDRSTGRKGTKRNASQRNQRRYCICGETRPRRSLLTASIKTVSPARIKLLSKKWIPKFCTLFLLFLFLKTFVKDISQGIYLFFRNLFVFQEGGKHGGQIPVIITSEEACILLPEICFLRKNRTVYKHPAFLFICKHSFCHKSLQKCLNRFRTPVHDLQHSVCNFICRDRRISPHGLHHLIFRF